MRTLRARSAICITFFLWTGVSIACLQLFCCLPVDEFSPGSPYSGSWLGARSLGFCRRSLQSRQD